MPRDVPSIRQLHHSGGQMDMSRGSGNRKNISSFVIARLFEAGIFAGIFFLIDRFVVDWFDAPQWWYHWMNNQDMAFEDAVDIAQRRQGDDRILFFVAFSIFIVAYYLALYAHKAYRARQRLSAGGPINRYDKKIIILRFGTLMMAGIGLAIASIPILDSTRTQHEASNPWIMTIIAGITALLLGFLPYYLFRKLSDALSFGYSLLVTLSCFALLCIGLYFHLNRATVGLANLLFLFIGYTTRLKELAAVWNGTRMGAAGDNA
jgi:hypothetical protein